MRFTVPQFIDYKAKIIGPLTIRQALYIGGAIGTCAVLKFMLPSYLFIMSCIVLGAISFALAFLKINGRDLPTVLGNFLTFSISPKMYIWRKAESPIMVFKKVEKKKEASEEESTLRVASKSRLKNLQTQIETKTK
ncbi:MAG: PrgI family protein [Candidatus Paceibacterota bacterium]